MARSERWSKLLRYRWEQFGNKLCDCGGSFVLMFSAAPGASYTAWQIPLNLVALIFHAVGAACYLIGTLNSAILWLIA